MTRQKISTGLGFSLLAGFTVILYWQFFFFGAIPLPGDTLIGAYFPWLDYKWGFPVGVPVKNALISDVFSQFFIWKYLAVDIFKSGQIPLWNIYALSGTPFLATYHSAVFNPFNLLLFLPRFYGWGFYISLQTFTAMLGMFLFLASKVKNFWTRILGAVVFSLSGLMTTWVEFGTGVWAASMLPWIFLFLDKFLLTFKLRFLFFMSFAFTILYLSGHAQLTLYSTILALIYTLVNFSKDKIKSKIYFSVLFITLAILLCSFQFLPTLEFTKNSIREKEAYTASFNYGLNPSYEVVKFFTADFFGNPTTGNYWDGESYHEQSVFLGTIPFMLILAIIIYTFSKKKFNFWIGVFLTTLILGFDNPVSKFIYSQPLPILTYSSAARIFFITSFSGAILTAIAFEKITEDKFREIFRKTNIVFLAMVSGLLIGMIISVLLLNNLFPSDLLQKNVANFKVSIRNSLLPLLTAIISLASVYLLVYQRRLQKTLVVVFVLVTFLELSRYFFKYNPFISQDLVFPETQAISFLKNQPGIFRIGRGDREVMPPNTWEFYKLQSVEGYDPLIFKYYSQVFNLINDLEFDATPSRYRELETYDSKFLNALNVRFFLTIKRDGEGKVKGDFISPKLTEAGYKIVFEDGNTAILENPGALPRAYFVKNVKTFTNEYDLIKILTDKSFDPGKQALIVSDKEIKELTGGGTVEIKSYKQNKIELKTYTSSRAFLIFSDSFDPGWKLYRNGKEEKLFKTNYAFRGMFVPVGENYFEMVYFPDSFRYGIWISAAGLSSFIMIFFYSLRKKKL